MNQQHFATYGHPSAMHQQQQQMYAAAARTNSGYGSQQFATVSRTASMSVGGALPPISTWTPPSPQEHQYYDVLFTVADEEKRNAIGGRLAVMFFSRSNADKQVLREIWNIADAQQRGELSRNEFYVAMRLISMAQRGDVVSVQRFFELAAVPFPLPVLDGVPPPPPVASPASASNAPARSPYAVTDEEKARYDAIFAQYDADHDGFLLGNEAVALFQMSGLDRNALREIWALADRGQDSKLDVREFYVAMHLIVCASKRGLPVPSQLPQELSDSVFGPSGRGSFALPGSDLAAAASQSRNGSLHESSSADANDDPFAGLSPAKDAAAPRLGSFSTVDAQSDSSAAATGLAPQPASSTAMPEHRGSFQQQQPTPPGSARGSFYGASMSMPMPPALDPHSAGLDQLHTAQPPSSTGSFSGIHGAPPSHVEGMAPTGMMNHHVGAPGLHGHAGMMGGGYGAVPPSPPMMPAMSSTKPFLSDDEEVQAVKQLDETNDEVVKCLTDIASKQRAIETLAEKLRELDQLRHDLVALSMKRESVRAANSAASAPSTVSSSASDQQQLQTKRAVESSLQDLVETEKRTVTRLQHDVAALETELQRSDSASLSSSFASMAVSSSTAPAPGAGDFSFAPVAKPAPASFDSFGALGGASSSASSTPVAAPASFDFAAPSPANSTSSAGFDSFGDFGASKPATTTTTSGGFDAFANFGFS